MDSIRNITLENLLTMTAPYKYKFAPYLKYFTSDDWVKFSLEQLGGKGQIGKFRYAPLIGPDLLSGISQRPRAALSLPLHPNIYSLLWGNTHS